METSATSATAMTKISGKSIVEAIIDCGKILDKVSAPRRKILYPMPPWMEKLYPKNIADHAALTAFKKNSSYWPEQFPWCRKQHLGRVFYRHRPFYREYKPVVSS